MPIAQLCHSGTRALKISEDSSTYLTCHSLFKLLGQTRLCLIGAPHKGKPLLMYESSGLVRQKKGQEKDETFLRLVIVGKVRL